MTTSFRVLCLALALGVDAVSSATAATADTSAEARVLVDRMVAAQGGWPRLQRVHAYRVEGRLFSIMRHEEAPTVRVFARPGRMKVLIDYAGGHEARVVDQGACWRATGGGALEPVSGPMLAATMLQAARAALPWILVEHVADAKRLEPMVQDSLRLPGVGIPLGGGLTLRVYVDPATGRMRMSQGLLDQGGMQTHFETWYDDWREVDGVWFAFHEENWASGTHTGSTVLEQVRIDPRLAPDEFTPPKVKGKARPSTGSSS